MRARLLFALLLIGCGSNPPTEPSDPTEAAGPPAELVCAEAPCALFEHLDRFALRGLASHVEGLELPDVAEDWRQDFSADPGGRFQGGAGGRFEGKGDKRHLVLRTRGKVPVWVSDPIPMAADREYSLRWRTALNRIASPPRDPGDFAGLTVRFYKVDGDVAAALSDDKTAKKLRVQAHRSAEWRPAEGRAPWHEESRTFRRPRSATHMVLRIAGGPAMAGGKTSLQVDDIILESRLAPTWTARKNDVWSEPGRHPLLRKARGAGAGHNKARDIREVVLAPAPSTLTADVVVPDGGTLALGLGLTPGRGKGKVRFEAAVVAHGKRTVVLEETASGSYRPGWKDRVIDLSRWAGQTVRLELTTKAKRAPKDVLTGVSRQPWGRAVWTTGQLEGSGTGRLAVLVIVDTLGANHASGWGGTRNQTPQLQRIAEGGTHYARGLAPSPWTLPSIATYLTGLTPDSHGAGQKLGNDHWDRRPVLPAFDTLAEKLRRAGWDTRGWVNNPFLAPRNSALDQGFVSYMDYGTRSEEHAAAPAVKQVLAEIARPGNGDRFILLHLLDPHGPYQPDADHQARFVDPKYDGPVAAGNSKGGFRDILNRRVNPSPADKQMLVDLHDGVVAYADAQVGAVFDAAQATGRDVLFVVTSDHGEEFWEHGRFEHGHSVYNELLHVPLLSWRTGGTPGRVEGAVDARGVFGTVLDFAGVEHPGTPSLPEAGEVAVFASPTLYGHRQRAAEQGGWKYILKQPETGENHRRVGPSPRQSLFDLSIDPGETNSRLSAAPEQAARLHEALVEEALLGFPGAWFVVASGEPSDVTLRQVGGQGWHPDVHDFPWPRADGQPLDKGALKVRRVQGAKASGVRLSIGHGPTLLILEPRDDDGRVEAIVGEGVTDVRHSGAQQGQTITFEADPVRSTPSELVAALRGETPRLMIGRLAGDLRPRGREDAPSGSDVAALRALGYME